MVARFPQDAACRHTRAERFFNVDEQRDAVLELCPTCPVLTACAQATLALPTEQIRVAGARGGMLPAQAARAAARRVPADRAARQSLLELADQRAREQREWRRQQTAMVAASVSEQAAGRLLAAVAASAGVSAAELTGRTKTRRLVAARTAVVAVLRQAGWSLTAIGRVLDRDHTTVLNLQRRMDAYRTQVADLLEGLQPPTALAGSLQTVRRELAGEWPSTPVGA